MKERIRGRARELGFDDCRFTSASPPETAVYLQHWLAAGMHGEMAYLERNTPKRVDPQQVLAGVRSVIVLLVNYAQLEGESGSAGPASSSGGQDAAQANSGELHGLAARYARFADYHEVIGERLKRLTEFVDQLDGSESRSLWYVDTGPVLEREFAQRAGIGFIGKHTNLISRRFGNWVFLAEILTTLDLEPDAPERNQCGSCARCIVACPTNAITAPFQLDARRCISYLTIELKDSIPVELRSLMGNRIFGCDDCLEACPWNRFAREASMMKGYARPDLGTFELLELLALDGAAFKRRFAGTPILRAKRRGLRRNVCVALANIGGATALPALQRAASDAEPLIAEHARWAIDQIESKRGQP